VKIDTSWQATPGPFCFRIHGGLYHRISSILPELGAPAQFSQVYMYDRAEENRIRYGHMSFLHETTLQALQDLMHTLPNPYVQLYLNMRRHIENNPESIRTMQFLLKAENTPDARRYNAAANENEIAVLMVGDGTQCSSRDIILRPLNGGDLKLISEKHRSYDSLGYPLIFPSGDDGWYIKYPAIDGTEMTPKMLYNFRLMYRNDNHSLHIFRNLFHQYIVDMYAKVEQHRLGYIYLNQRKLKAAQYKGLSDALAANDTDLRTIGRRVILPSTFIGGPRHMAQLFQDAISIVSKYGRPDLFITFTCNPAWLEIRGALLHDQSAADRPDLCARVFKLKLDKLMDDLLDKQILGM